jgi:hypothetical protein
MSMTHRTESIGNTKTENEISMENELRRLDSDFFSFSESTQLFMHQNELSIQFYRTEDVSVSL